MTAHNNRVISKLQIPSEMIDSMRINQEDPIHNYINTGLIHRIADEIHRTKSSAIKTQMINNSPAGPQYETLIELYVFTKQELEDLLNRTKMEASLNIKEQITLVENWKNK